VSHSILYQIYPFFNILTVIYPRSKTIRFRSRSSEELAKGCKKRVNRRERMVKIRKEYKEYFPKSLIDLK
jgi:hypothetical protein